MKLSKLKALSKKTFSTFIPSTSQEVFGKPYTLDDEITIASLFQLEDMRFFYAAIANLLLDKYDLTPTQLNDLTHIDIQWLIIQLKKASDGSKLSIQFECSNEKCQETLATDIDLNDIKLHNQQSFRKTIILSDVVSVEVGVPLFEDFFEIMEQFRNTKESEHAEFLKKDIELFKRSIKGIYEGDSLTRPSDLSSEEFNTIVREDLREAYLKFVEYREKEYPALIYPKKIVCGKCKSEIELSVDDFFYSTL